MKCRTQSASQPSGNRGGLVGSVTGVYPDNDDPHAPLLPGCGNPSQWQSPPGDRASE